MHTYANEWANNGRKVEEEQTSLLFVPVVVLIVSKAFDNDVESYNSLSEENLVA